MSQSNLYRLFYLGILVAALQGCDGNGNNDSTSLELFPASDLPSTLVTQETLDTLKTDKGLSSLIIDLIGHGLDLDDREFDLDGPILQERNRLNFYAEFFEDKITLQQKALHPTTPTEFSGSGYVFKVAGAGTRNNFSFRTSLSQDLSQIDREDTHPNISAGNLDLKRDLIVKEKSYRDTRKGTATWTDENGHRYEMKFDSLSAALLIDDPNAASLKIEQKYIDQLKAANDQTVENAVFLDMANNSEIRNILSGIHVNGTLSIDGKVYDLKPLAKASILEMIIMLMFISQTDPDFEF